MVRHGARRAVRRWLLALGLAALLGGAAGAVAAQDVSAGEPEGWAYDVANELMSPFCPGRTLADCPSQQAKSLVMWMVVQEAAGRSRADVEQELYDRYGDVLRPAPKAQGFGLAAYLIPAIAFGGGGLLLFAFLRGQTRGAPPPGLAVPAELDPELARIVDREIAG